MYFRHLHRIILALFVALLAAGCATPREPMISVLGISEPQFSSPAAPQVVFVYIEVANPSSRDLQLARLEYQLRTPRSIDAEGEVDLSRAVAAGASAVIEIAVPVESRELKRGLSYELRGVLVAVENDTERSWRVAAEGALVRDARGGLALRPPELRLADRSR